MPKKALKNQMNLMSRIPLFTFLQKIKFIPVEFALSRVFQMERLVY